MNKIPLLRTMTLGDLDKIMALEKTLFVDAWSRRSYEYEIRENRYSLPVVLELDGKMIGHAVAWHVFDEFHIATLGIHPDFQRQGWGSYLLKLLLSMSDGAAFVLLEVRKSNTAALRLYEKFGFIPLRIRRNYYRDGEDAIVMRKQLNGL